MQYSGMRTFFIIWFGQLVSLFGTGMTRFALIIWAYQQTGSATTLALLGFFGYGSAVVAGIFASAWIDRFDKRKIMLISDAGAGFTTIGLLILFATNNLDIWHLYLAQIVVGSMDAFQIPAYNAVVTTLIPKKHFSRANGLKSLAGYMSSVLAPFFAGLALVAVGIGGVMLFDVITFLIAVATLIVAKIPLPKLSSDSDKDSSPTFWANLRVGLRYIGTYQGLIGLIVIMTVINFFASLTYLSIMPAMILARTGGDELALSIVQASLGIGGVIGSILLSTWGGTKRQIHGVLAGTGLSFILGDFLFAIGQDVLVWAFAAITAAAFIPFITGGNMAIWQRKVPVYLQGRVFAVQSTIRTATIPLGFILGGLLADHIFEPAMMPHGALADTFGWLVGTGAGAGMGLMFVCTALLGSLTGFCGYLFYNLRNVEDVLPDFDDIPESVLQPAPA